MKNSGWRIKNLGIYAIRTGNNSLCETCKKAYYRKPSQKGKYCSRKCYFIASPTWKNGDNPRFYGNDNPSKLLEVREKIRKKLSNRKFSSETREKMSKTRKTLIKLGKIKAYGYGIMPPKVSPMRGKKNERARLMQLTNNTAKYVRNPSKPQKIFYEFIKKFYPDAQLNYKVPVSSSKNYYLDIVIPSKMMNFEVDGSYWHKDKIKDEERDKLLRTLNWTVHRIPVECINQLIKKGEFIWSEDFYGE